MNLPAKGIEESKENVAREKVPTSSTSWHRSDFLTILFSLSVSLSLSILLSFPPRICWTPGKNSSAMNATHVERNPLKLDWAGSISSHPYLSSFSRVSSIPRILSSFLISPHAVSPDIWLTKTSFFAAKIVDPNVISVPSPSLVFGSRSRSIRFLSAVVLFSVFFLSSR